MQTSHADINAIRKAVPVSLGCFGARTILVNDIARNTRDSRLLSARSFSVAFFRTSDGSCLWDSRLSFPATFDFIDFAFRTNMSLKLPRRPSHKDVQYDVIEIAHNYQHARIFRARNPQRGEKGAMMGDGAAV